MYTTISNRKNQTITVMYELQKKPKGLVFVMHGLGGFKEQPHIETIRKAFFDNYYSVVCFDTTNSFGESDGIYDDATLTNYFEDLEDVINWSRSEIWYNEPFCLAGHSLGSMCEIMYAKKYPNRIKALAPLSTVVSGRLFAEALGADKVENWRRTGKLVEESKSRPGEIKKLKIGFLDDILKYDIQSELGKIKIPVLMAVGENDNLTPLRQQKIIFDKLVSKKEFHILKNASHTFREEEHLKTIYKFLSEWINKLDY